MRLMPREMRMMSERILSLTSLPKGFLLAIKDLPMYSQLLGLGGFHLLEAQLPALRAADPGRIRLRREEEAQLELDAQGQHAWVVVPSLLELSGELVQRYGRARLRVEDVAEPLELQTATALASRFGLELHGLGGSGAPPVAGDRATALGVVELEARPKVTTGQVSEDDPLLWSALMHGTPIDPELWWRIYHLAKQALEPDNPVSRRHAGTVIVLDDGRILGRADGDDETDLGFIAAAGPQPSPAGDDSR